MKNLIALDLDNNRINSIPAHIFSSLPKPIRYNFRSNCIDPRLSDPEEIKFINTVFTGYNDIPHDQSASCYMYITYHGNKNTG